LKVNLLSLHTDACIAKWSETTAPQTTIWIQVHFWPRKKKNSLTNISGCRFLTSHQQQKPTWCI